MATTSEGALADNIEPGGWNADGRPCGLVAPPRSGPERGSNSKSPPRHTSLDGEHFHVLEHGNESF